MKRRHLALGSAALLGSAVALAQGAPESLLPPMFDKTRNTPRIETEPVIERGTPAPSGTPTASTAKTNLPANLKLPDADRLKTMSADELGELLGLKSQSDMPVAARRAMKQIGLIAPDEGGLPAHALAGQDATLVRAILAGNKGVMVSRWGHILMRRALASRLDAPAAMNPADFAALRAALLVRMGEAEAARALVQDIDTGNYSPALIDAATNAYIATSDFTGMCPMMAVHGSARKDAQWQAFKAICDAFLGDGNASFARLDRLQGSNALPKIDVLLAQKYAGAAGKARRAVKIEWDGVNTMTPMRYGLTLAVGLEPPARLMPTNRRGYDLAAATAPMLGLPQRMAAADRAAGVGILSSAAMVDLYGQVAAQDDIDVQWTNRTDQLRTAYVGSKPTDRVSAMRQLWDGAADDLQRHSRQVLTAYAAARLTPDPSLADDAAPLIASMLAAGLDRNAMSWARVVESGSEGWALLALAAPRRPAPVDEGQLEAFRDNDESPGTRKSAFLLAGLAGLGRISPATARGFAGKLEVDLGKASHWSRLIDRAADVNNPALVALLAGLGMQGESWDKMTPRHLFHIVSALSKVGLEAEARMIAAEAVARG